MPTYEYVCAKCDEHIEAYQSFSDEPLKKHTGCGGKLTKVMGSVGIVLKGSGFYRTDNRSGSRSRTDASGPESGKSDAGKSESGASGAGKSDSGSSGSSSGDAKPSEKKAPAKTEKKSA
jgi:putative FmdB family regulatory protein